MRDINLFNYYTLMLNNKFSHALMAAVAILSLAACGSDDDVDPVVTPPADPTFTVSFEDQKLNDNGFWCGTAEGQGQILF